MAKKARKKLEEDAEPAFEFPEFDVRKFVHHEFEQSSASIFAIVVAVVLSLASFGLSYLGILAIVPLLVGLAGIVFSPFVLQRIRPKAVEYTKGDWAGLIVIELFGWLGGWFLLLNVARVAV